MSCTVLEASDGVGGRVRTDVVDGFLLDRGFQIFLTSYPSKLAHIVARDPNSRTTVWTHAKPHALVSYVNWADTTFQAHTAFGEDRSAASGRCNKPAAAGTCVVRVSH